MLHAERHCPSGLGVSFPSPDSTAVDNSAVLVGQGIPGNSCYEGSKGVQTKTMAIDAYQWLKGRYAL